MENAGSGGSWRRRTEANNLPIHPYNRYGTRMPNDVQPHAEQQVTHEHTGLVRESNSSWRQTAQPGYDRNATVRPRLNLAPRTVRALTYEFLKNKEQTESPKELLLWLNENFVDLRECLHVELTTGMTAILIKVFAKACESTEPAEVRLNVLQFILKNDFLPKIPEVIYDILADKLNTRQREMLNNALKLMNYLLSALPNTSTMQISMVMLILDPIFIDVQGSMNMNERELYEEVKTILADLKVKGKADKVALEKDTLDWDDPGPAPNNFRDLKMLPRAKELQSHVRCFLRANLTSKAYESIDHYLDVQYRLLREDLVRPLGDAVKVIRNNGPLDKNIKAYQYVKVEQMVSSRRGVLYRLSFDTCRLSKERCENSKRLLPNNLLCLSSDNFNNDIFFATVATREPGWGFVTVQLLDDPEEEKYLAMMNVFWPDPDFEDKLYEPTRFDLHKTYAMVESEAYFEAYRHVLLGLQETREIPLGRYIVHCVEEMRPPEYLTSLEGRITAFDFSSIAGKGTYSAVEILHKEAWPLPEKMAMNQSQLDAMRLALTNELAIIQGPPGTGKTHVGLAIMRILLENKNQWGKDEKHRCPILVVCYTNHALDQFIEGVAKFSPQLHAIVRVGGQCKNEKIKPFSLGEIRKGENEYPHWHGIVRDKKSARELICCLNILQLEMETKIKRMEEAYHSVPGYDVIEKFISSHLERQFVTHGNEDQQLDDLNNDELNEALQSWLGFACCYNTVDKSESHPGELVAYEDAFFGSLESMFPVSTHKDGDIPSDEASSTNWRWREEKEDGPWQRTKQDKRSIRNKIRKELRKTTTMSREEVAGVRDIHSLPNEEKWRLYRTWVARWRKEFHARLDVTVEKHAAGALALKRIYKRQDAQILRSADVIAATTSGVAKYRELLPNCKIVVVEEAAEVLEPHIITSMPKSTQHLILIGDHQQLKPSPTVYELAKRYNLDTSLFERLVKKIPHVTLSHQHRMRPEIADLIRPHFYKNLQDHESVLSRGEITGIQKPVFFLSHRTPESVADGRSKRNPFEADFILALCKYIIQQEYKPEQITILTTYSGQLEAFKSSKAFEEIPKGVRITAVDNFQGEENDIILLSLVRSNSEESIGFLEVDNRICVALSRAKYALYCIGNMGLLALKSPTWRKIIRNLKTKESIGESLILRCKHHPDRITPVKCARDFIQVPEGGCGQPCRFRLNCGHVCPRACHPEDHSEYKCKKTCGKVLSCAQSHKCIRECWESCDPCCQMVEKIMPKCDHVQEVECFQLADDTIDCKTMVSVCLPCSHEVEVQCCMTDDRLEGQCKVKCLNILECGHQCVGSCGECFQGRLHLPCQEERCNRIFRYGHVCDSNCSSCPPCKTECRTRQAHLKPTISGLRNLHLANIQPFDERRREEVQQLFEEIKSQEPELHSSLPISDEENEMTCGSMRFAAKDRWYSCSKGHVYAIGECGEAMEFSVCPECKEELGSSHQLVATNHVTTEMDGATGSAYDTTSNCIPTDLLDELRREGFG